MKKYDTEKSKELFLEAQKYLLNGVASYFQKSAMEEYPICVTHGRGSHVYDVDGNEYIDYVGGMGPMLLGFHPDPPLEAISRQLERGSHFSATTPQLCELSKKLTEIIPCAELVSFQNSGTEADMFAVRAARAYTGKLKLIKFESTYHGWGDELKVSVDANSESVMGDKRNPAKLITTKGQRKAASDDLIIMPFNDIEILRETFAKQGHEIAAVIMEAFICDSGPIPPRAGYLEQVVELAHSYNSIVIFDEVITGFRLSLGGAQQYFGVTPDLATFAKAAAACLPIAIVAGKKEIMECGVTASGTLNGNPLVVSAALAAIKECEKPGTYQKMEALGNELAGGLVETGRKYGMKMSAKAYGGLVALTVGMDRAPVDFREWLNCSDIKLYNELFLRCREYGVRLTERRGRLCLTTEYQSDDIARTIAVVDTVLNEIVKGA